MIDINRCTRIFAVASALMAAPLSSAWGQAVPRRVTLEEALALFARNNVDLRVARAEAGEAAALARQAAAYPNPELAASHEPLTGDGRTYSETYLNLSQRVQWPGTRSARQSAAQRIAAAAAARLTADSARLAFEVKQAWLAAALAEGNAHVLERTTGVFREAERRAEERLREGDISVYDRRRIGVERIRYESALATATLEAGNARRILALLVLPESDELELAPADTLANAPPALDSARVMAQALARRSEIAAAAAELEAARADARVARSGRIPDVTTTAGYKRQSDGLSGAFLGLSVPLPIWNRSGGDIDAAEARVAAATARLADAQRRVRNDVARALLAYRSYVDQIAMLGDPQGDAADLLTIAQVAYDANEMDLIELLDAADALREAQALETRLRAEFWTSYFDLERAIGGFDGSMDDEEDT
ncbi:MAG TPA: TolC family protein [Longimicrobiales bacterium]|nr:TolC family protein [Longimicrobiales bacterium]